MNHSEIAKVTYKNTVITYDEHANDWTAEHNHEKIGKAETLAKAKVLVDRWIKEEDTFKRHTAIYLEYEYCVSQVEVTSLCKDLNWEGKKQAWISIKDGPNKGTRKKVGLHELRADTPGNRQLIKEMEECGKVIAAQHKLIDLTKKKLTPYTIPS